MIDKLVKIVPITLLVGLLSACSSAPRQVEANTPLITDQSVQSNLGELIPSQYWAILNDGSQTVLTTPSQHIQLSPIYISALNQRCRSLNTVNQPNLKQLACSRLVTTKQPNNNVAWYLSPSIQPGTVLGESTSPFYKSIQL